jgi:hypothetical protein
MFESARSNLDDLVRARHLLCKPRTHRTRLFILLSNKPAPQPNSDHAANSDHAVLAEPALQPNSDHGRTPGAGNPSRTALAALNSASDNMPSVLQRHAW